MKTIETLERALQMSKDKIENHSRYGSEKVLETFKDQEKALTEAIDSLKCDKLARVREEALKKLLAIKPINHAIYNMGHQDGLRSLILFIDQLDREQA